MKYGKYDHRAICEGIRQTGHWKGYQCGAYAVYEQEGKGYCRNHVDATISARELTKEERKRESGTAA